MWNIHQSHAQFYSNNMLWKSQINMGRVGTPTKHNASNETKSSQNIRAARKQSSRSQVAYFAPSAISNHQLSDETQEDRLSRRVSVEIFASQVESQVIPLPGQEEKPHKLQSRPSTTKADTLTPEEDPVWFQIEKETDAEDPSKLEAPSQSGMSYQEIMVFSKFVDVFEDNKFKNQMMFWLLMMFPLGEMQCPNFIRMANALLMNKGGKQNVRQTYVSESFSDSLPSICLSDSELEEEEEEEDFGIYQHSSKLEYLFPLNHFQLFLDNMCFQQVLDLYFRLSGSCKRPDSLLYYEPSLSLMEYEYIWTLPLGFCSSSQRGEQGFLYKDILMAAIKQKYDEAISVM